jgi:hypothetical protein
MRVIRRTVKETYICAKTDNGGSAPVTTATESDTETVSPLNPLDCHVTIPANRVVHGFIPIHTENPSVASCFYFESVRAQELAQKRTRRRMFARYSQVEEALVGGTNVGAELFKLFYGDCVPFRPGDTGGELGGSGCYKKRLHLHEGRNSAELGTHLRMWGDLYRVQGLCL